MCAHAPTRSLITHIAMTDTLESSIVRLSASMPINSLHDGRCSQMICGIARAQRQLDMLVHGRAEGARMAADKARVGGMQAAEHARVRAHQRRVPQRCEAATQTPRCDRGARKTAGKAFTGL